MAPKKKGNKRQEEDWEAELGEAAPGADGDTQDKPDETPADGEDEAAGSGGLLAALRKNKNKKAKKGKPINDFVEGEDPAAEEGGADANDFSNKAPEEGTFDDEEDVFAGKAQKSAKAAAAAAKAEAAAQEPEGDGFRVKSKKEKEKEKKEKEKQRKREQVYFLKALSFDGFLFCSWYGTNQMIFKSRLPARRSLQMTRNNPPNQPRKNPLGRLLLPPRLPLPHRSPLARKRRFPLTWLLSRNSRKLFGNSVRRKSDCEPRSRLR